MSELKSKGRRELRREREYGKEHSRQREERAKMYADRRKQHTFEKLKGQSNYKGE